MRKNILKDIRAFASNTLATTALSVLIMCLAAAIQGFTLWGVTIPFEMLLVNFLAHAGFFALRRLDLNPIAAYAVMLVYLTGLLIGFGFLFGWFRTVAIWVICLVGFLVFLAAIAIDVWKVNRDAATINEKLKRLNADTDEADTNEEK